MGVPAQAETYSRGVIYYGSQVVEAVIVAVILVLIAGIVIVIVSMLLFRSCGFVLMVFS